MEEPAQPCKLCGSNAPLVKSHIIPTSFLFPFDQQPVADPPDGETSGTYRIMGDIESMHPSRAPTGIYDRFLCCDCENLFDPWDDYAFKLLCERRGERKRIERENRLIAELYESFEYVKLKLFFMSLLFRAALSDGLFWQHIRLGPHESRLRDLVKRADPGEQNDFPVCLARFSNSDQTPIFLPPFRTRFQGVSFYRFYLGIVIAHIKVDRQRISAPMNLAVMSDGNPLYLRNYEYSGSAEQKALRGIFGNPTNIRLMERYTNSTLAIV